MKAATILVLVFFFILPFKYSLGNYVEQVQNSYFIMNGECNKVINSLRKDFKNDSIAVDFFLKNYKIARSTITFKTGTPASIIIKYFNKEENKKIQCTYKHIDNDKVLLDTTRTH